MKDETILLLCPANMTSPRNGPNGFLGDRIHQLPAVALASRLYSQVYVWPKDPITKQVFAALSIKFLEGDNIESVVAHAKALNVERVVCLHANPAHCPTERFDDCRNVKKSRDIAVQIAPDNHSFPDDLDPKGRISLWRQLVLAVRPATGRDLQWPQPPFLVPPEESRIWARQLLGQIGDDPFLVVSPLSGGPKNTVEDNWWAILAEQFSHGNIVVPVHQPEISVAERLFAGATNVTVVAADIMQTASLAAADGVHVLGIDGGRMNVLAAAKSDGVLTIYGDWPASAWALPRVVVKDSTTIPEEALANVP